MVLSCHRPLCFDDKNMPLFGNADFVSFTVKISSRKVCVGTEGMCDSSTHITTHIRTFP